jgi:holo-ACP synthase
MYGTGTGILDRILKAREARAERQKELIKMHSCSLITFTLNIPGPNKDSLLYREVHREGMRALLKILEEEKLEIIYKCTWHRETGAEAFVCINGDAAKLKELTVQIEERHYLGRIFDYDVIDRNMRQISRKSIGLDERKCLLCPNSVHICRRDRNHSIEDLINKISEISNEYFSDKYNKLSRRWNSK